MQQKQDSFGALQKLDEADAISPGSALIANVRGSIYTAPPLRDYAKARECFEAAEKLLPAAFEPKFNKTELLYVEHKYAEAEAAFAKLLADFLKLREEVRHLIQFKIIVCQLKQGKVAEAKKIPPSLRSWTTPRHTILPRPRSPFRNQTPMKPGNGSPKPRRFSSRRTMRFISTH